MILLLLYNEHRTADSLVDLFHHRRLLLGWNQCSLGGGGVLYLQHTDGHESSDRRLLEEVIGYFIRLLAVLH